ncbi:MAG: S1 RNA-binding domain-containing protein [Oscillospiraceae bacterium]|nr:S1 RNA-binding domain-containing protein [Oscillospiraceae bacterium]
MENGLGNIVTGKVTSITKFGAFVTLPDNRSGLVHISEVSFTYVNDIREHLTEGQEIPVKIIGVDRGGKINLSVKQALKAPAPSRGRAPERTSPRASAPPGPQTFEDKLKAFMSDSERKMGDLRQQEKRPARRRK